MKPRMIGHVSDLLMCIRARVFSELDPKRPGKRKMNMYSSGKSGHETIQSLLASDRGRFEKEYLVEYKGMTGSVDVYDKRLNIPIEFKTPRSSGLIREAYDYNVIQIKTYMSMLGASCGIIIYQLIANKDKDEETDYQGFWIHMTTKEHLEHLELMLARLENLETAIAVEEPAIADAVYDNPKLKWLCNGCPYLEPCQQMR